MQENRKTRGIPQPGEKASRNNPGFVALAWPTALCVLLFLAAFEGETVLSSLGLSIGAEEAVWLVPALAVLFWLTVAFTLQRWMALVFWGRIVETRTGAPTPALLVGLTGALLYLCAFIIVLGFVFDLQVTGVLTASSVVLAVIGFALRTMISDLFTGIALGVEQPFRIGDWIALQSGTVGRVVDMNWRATRLVTQEEVSVVVSNSELASGSFKNYSMPEGLFRDEVEILLSYSVTSWRVERLMKSAVWSVPEVVDVPREPDVRIKAFTENGILWQIRFWVPDYAEMHRLRYEVQRAILRNLHFSGVRIPGQRVDLRSLPKQVRKKDIDFLHAVDLLAPLTDEEILIVNDHMQQKLFKRGTPIVSQGEAGSSLFVVKEGMLSVYVSGEDGRETRVGSLSSGSFFGEMSLLTGAPRGASVVPEVDSLGFEITREYLAPILKNRPKLAEYLSEALAERQMRTREAFAAMDHETGSQQRESLTKELLNGIRRYFSL